MTRALDLNCDLGESDTAEGERIELELLQTVTSANIACGGHAGNSDVMMRTVKAAIANDVAIGAHPGYPDRANFGRVSMPLSPAEIEAMCFEQISALGAIAMSSGARLNHVKTHGALYHDAMRDKEISLAIGRAVLRINPGLIMVGFPGAAALAVWRMQEFSVITEAFADRTYESDGSLRKRTLANALITDPAAAAAQAVRLAKSHPAPETLCIHSDTANAPMIARTVRIGLIDAGFAIRAPGGT